MCLKPKDDGLNENKLSVPLSLYIHIPWCLKKCPYCDFNSHRMQEGVREERYVDALVRDFESQLSAIQNRSIGTIFFGGGTPSLFSADAIASILAAIRARVQLDADVEITLEANPGASESTSFRGYREAGVNRLSIGVQSFDKAMLSTLGRVHGREEAFQSIEKARKAGFENVNLDLMFGLPNQTMASAIADVTSAIDLAPTHISFYQFTIEPNTFFQKYPPRLLHEEAIWAIQKESQALLSKNGFVQYEVSAYARGQAMCRHNLNYWEFGDYMGIGAGSHGKLTELATGIITRTSRIKHPEHYQDTVFTQEQGRIEVANSEVGFEFMMNALRLIEGFDVRLFTARTGLPISSVESEIKRCITEGMLEKDGHRIRCSAQGMNFLDNILQRFLD